MAKGAKKDTFDEFEQFMQKVQEVESIINGLKSKDEALADKAAMKAELYLRTKDKNENKEIEEELLKEIHNRTVINKKAFGNEDPNTMSTEAFMKSVEKDAKERAEQRRQCKEASDNYKRLGNHAFREGDFHKALNYYNKAIDETKDSCLLYTNRAQSLIKLGLYQRAITDCDKALRLNETSMKAKIHKAEALFHLGDLSNSDELLAEASSDHPNRANEIKEFKQGWIASPATENQSQDENL